MWYTKTMKKLISLFLLMFNEVGQARDPYRTTVDAIMAYPQIKFHKKRAEEYLWKQIWIDRNDLATIGATVRILTSKEIDTNLIKIRHTFKGGYINPRIVYNFETKETNIRVFLEYRF